MFDWVKHNSATGVIAVMALVTVSVAPAAYAQKLGLGTPAKAEEIQGWDIDIRPDGKGLPDGSGTAITGEDIYVQRCASCHGEFAEGAGRWPVLAGGEDSLDTEDPVKTVGSYWPYASTVFDYVRRAMPFGHAQSLKNDEVYAITAFILNASDVIEDDFELNKTTLPAVQMPNRDGFINDPRPDVPAGEPCMSNCLAAAPKIVGKARQIDVTPEDEGEKEAAAAPAGSGADIVAGEKAFAVCAACHSLTPGEAKFGPSLAKIEGRKAGGDESFTNYSAAMKAAGFVWDAETLKAYIANPQGKVPGTSMPFGGIKDETTLANLLAYLAKASKP